MSRLLAVGAVFLLILAFPGPAHTGGGNVSGEAEKAIVAILGTCMDAVRDVFAALEGLDDKDPVTGQAQADANAALGDFADCAVALVDALDDQQGNFQESTFEEDAALCFADAALELLDANEEIDNGSQAKKARKPLAEAARLLLASKLLMQGRFIDKKDKSLVADEDAFPTDTYAEDFNGKEVAKAIAAAKSLFEDGAAAQAASAEVSKSGKKVKKKKARKKVEGDGKTAQVKVAKKKAAKKKKSKSKSVTSSGGVSGSGIPKSLSDFLESKEPKDSFVSFEAKGKDLPANGAFAFINLDRQVTGPFEARVMAGAIDATKIDVTGAAFACIEFDVTGSSPLDFLAACAQPGNGGIRAFVLVDDGANSVEIGTFFFAFFSQLELVITYDGTDFTVEAKIPGQSDVQLQEVATHTRVQGDDTWTPGIGGAGLTGKAQVGIDDVVITEL